jgi:hypothetical protein
MIYQSLQPQIDVRDITLTEYVVSGARRFGSKVALIEQTQGRPAAAWYQAPMGASSTPATADRSNGAGGTVGPRSSGGGRLPLDDPGATAQILGQRRVSGDTVCMSEHDSL